MAASEENTKTTLDRQANILTSDLLIVDNSVPLPDAAQLAHYPGELQARYQQIEMLLNRLLAKHHTERGGKIPLTSEEYQVLANLTHGLPGIKMVPGGSSVDILTTMKGLLGEKMDVDFIGSAGRGTNDSIILDDLRKNGIDLFPQNTPGAYASQSFIFTDPDGKHTWATYPGTAEDLIKPELVSDALLARNNILFLPVSLWGKFGSALPETLFKKAWEQDKQIFLSIPRQARFGSDIPDDIYSWLIPSADVIMVDDVSLQNIYGTDDLQAAMQKLQQDMGRHNQVREQAGEKPRQKPATALVQHSDHSITVLIDPSSGISPASYSVAAPEEVKNDVYSWGMGDAIYAGFLAGQIRGLTPQQSAEFAMKVGLAKSDYAEEPKIPSPVDANEVTRNKWNNLHSELDTAFSDVGSAFSYGRTGVHNPSEKGPKTKGMWIFDNVLFNLTNIAVFLISIFATYKTTYSNNPDNWLKKRGDNFRGFLQKKGLSEGSAKNLNMVVWSFADGSIMAPFVAYLETKRNRISRWIDEKLGSVPEDESVYGKQPHQGWMSVILGRASAAVIVLSTFFALNKKWIGKNSGEKTSLNYWLFDKPAEKVMEHNFLHIPSGLQKLHFNKSQTGGLIQSSFFETFYTTACTIILFFVSALFGKHRKHKETDQTNEPSVKDSASAPVSQEKMELEAANTMDHSKVFLSPDKYRQVQIAQQAGKFSDRQMTASTSATPTP